MKNIRLIFTMFILLIYFENHNQYVFALENTNDVSVTDIFHKIDDYDGKELLIVGYYHINIESFYLHDNKGNTIWLGNISKKANLRDLEEVQNSFTRIRGIFKKGRSGHLGMYKCRIDEIKIIEPISEFDEYAPLGFKLNGIVISKGHNKALFTDQNGKGWVFKPGQYFPSLLNRKIKKIMKDRIIISEEIETEEGNSFREIEIVLNKNQKLSNQ